MGVSGSGKTTVGRLLSEELGWKFYEGDDFHPSANVQKMRRAIPLDDTDRKPWLDILRNLIRTCLEQGDSAVLTCSALKKSYREFLRIDERVVFIYLRGDYEIIRQRLIGRPGHFMKPDLLDSQFEALEEPEAAMCIDVSASPHEIVESIKNHLRL
jgi:gluconokinase